MKPINDLPRGSTTHLVNGKRTQKPFYYAWRNMLARCSSKFKVGNETYKCCNVCDEWLKLSAFKKWFDRNHVEGWNLDKDLLIEGNKLYSPETCRFIPHSLNTLFVARDKLRGKHPKGVYYDNDLRKFRALLTVERKTTHVGCYETAEDAEIAYLKAKKNYALSLIPKYKSEGVCHELLAAIERKF